MGMVTAIIKTHYIHMGIVTAVIKTQYIHMGIVTAIKTDSSHKDSLHVHGFSTAVCSAHISFTQEKTLLLQNCGSVGSLCSAYSFQYWHQTQNRGSH